MASKPGNDNSGEAMSPEDLRQQLREARIDRDGWKIQAELSDARLRKILKSPAWRLTKPFRILNVIAWSIKPELLDDSIASWQIQNAGPTVWDQVKDSLSYEAKNANLESSKIAVFAHWAKNSEVSLSTTRLLTDLLDNDFEVVLVSACESKSPLILIPKILDRITIIRKPNVGYDFGSWSVGLISHPEIRNAAEVLLINDSNSGPFGSVSGLLKAMSESPFDITGVTDSLQHRYHIQSFMMHFKNHVLKQKPMTEFWQNIRNQNDKFDVVQAYELGMTSTAQGNGIYVGAIYPWNMLTDYWENSSVKAWRRLLDLGYPFIKREIVRSLSSDQISDLTEKYFSDSNEKDTFTAMLKQDSQIQQI